MPDLDHTPRGWAARYTPECYDGMRDDSTRTASYRAAIAAAVEGKVVVDLGTGALALLAIFAAQAGARHVYAIEVQAVAAKAARETIQRAGLADRITVIEGFSTDAAVLLPEKADLMIHELIGEVAGEEGVVAAIVDAKRRHIAPHASAPLSIPSRARTLVAPCEYPDPSYCALQTRTALDAPGSGQALKLLNLPASARLAAPQTFEDLRFDSGSPAASQQTTLEFVLARAGLLRGLALHVELHCGAGGAEDPPDVSSDWVGTHWRNILLLLGDGVELEAGDVVRVRTGAELGGPQPRYTFEAFVGRGGIAEVAVGTEAGGGMQWAAVGGKIEYPEAGLNVNDMMDLMMATD